MLRPYNCFRQIYKFLFGKIASLICPREQFLKFVTCVKELPHRKNMSHRSAFSHFASKVIRAMDRNPKPFEYFIKDKMPVIAVENKSRKASNTLMIKINYSRILKSLEQIARALYFHRYGNKFLGKCVISCDFTLYYGQENDVFRNDFLYNASKQMRDYFESNNHAGDNPEVFKYFLEDVDKGCVLRMQFYGGSNVFVAFVHN